MYMFCHNKKQVGMCLPLPNLYDIYKLLSIIATILLKFAKFAAQYWVVTHCIMHIVL